MQSSITVRTEHHLPTDELLKLPPLRLLVYIHFHRQVQKINNTYIFLSWSSVNLFSILPITTPLASPIVILYIVDF